MRITVLSERVGDREEEEEMSDDEHDGTQRGLVSGRQNEFEQDSTYTEAASELLDVAIPILMLRGLTVGVVLTRAGLMSTLGTAYQGAAGLLGSYQLLTLVVPVSHTFALETLFAQAIGHENRVKIQQLMKTALRYSLYSSIPTICCYLTSDFVLSLIGQPYKHAMVVSHYLRRVVWVVPIEACLFPCSMLLISHRQLNVMIIAQIMRYFVYVGLAIGMSQGQFGFPRMGFDGLAYAEVGSVCFLGLLYFGIISRHPIFAEYRWCSGGWFHSEVAREYRTDGWSVALYYIPSYLSFVMLNLMAGMIDEDAQAAAQPVTQYYGLFDEIYRSLLQAATILISYSFARGDYYFALKLGRVCAALSLIPSAVINVMYFAMPRPLLSVFLHQQQNRVVEHATVALQRSGGALAADGLLSSFVGSLRGIKDINIPSKLSTASIWVFGILLAVVLLLAFENRVEDIFLAYSVGMGAAALSTGARWFRLFHSPQTQRAFRVNATSRMFRPVSEDDDRYSQDSERYLRETRRANTPR